MSTAAPARTFTAVDAVRRETPLLVGLMGPSGGGKTYSALRLASGIQRVTGGEIAVIDTEARRALHYADKFRFKHIEFGSPFSPNDYLQAIRYAVSIGAKCIVVDSMSHEHEGVGGVVAMHAANVERMSDGDAKRADRVKMAAWIEPKQKRREMINGILQMQANFIFCFRAKEKLDIKPGQQPKSKGYMPIAGEEFVFEMTLNALLLPGADGKPTWQPEEPGERQMVKLPGQFRELLSGGAQLSEDIGERLARWAKGDEPAAELSPEDREYMERCKGEIATIQTAAEWTEVNDTIKRANVAVHTRLRSQLGDKWKQVKNNK